MRRHHEPEAIEVQVDHRCRIQGEHLAHDQAADDRDAERTPELRPVAAPEGEGQGAEQRGHRGHHDRPEAQNARLEDRFLGALAFPALGVEGEVDHHDRVLLHDPDQENDTDQGDDAEFDAEEKQAEQRAHAGGGQGGEDRDRMHVALVQDAEHDVDGYQGGEDQPRLVFEG